MRSFPRNSCSNKPTSSGGLPFLKSSTRLAARINSDGLCVEDELVAAGALRGRRLGVLHHALHGLHAEAVVVAEAEVLVDVVYEGLHGGTAPLWAFGACIFGRRRGFGVAFVLDLGGRRPVSTASSRRTVYCRVDGVAFDQI